MISGDKLRTVEEFLLIDRSGDGLAFNRALEGEMLIGVPFGWYAVGQKPFIEVVKDGTVIASINCDDIAIVRFSGKDKTENNK